MIRGKGRHGITSWEDESMTICIAAKCDYGSTLVLVGDKELGIGITSADFREGKFGALAKEWSLGIAGPVANATDL